MESQNYCQLPALDGSTLVTHVLKLITVNIGCRILDVDITYFSLMHPSLSVDV